MRTDSNNQSRQYPTSVVLMGERLTPIARVTLVALAYIFVGWLCTILTGLGSHPSPLWFPSGIGLAALLLWGQIVWLGIFSGDFSLNLILGESWGFGIISAIGSTLTALVGWKFLRYFQFSPSLTALKDVLSLVFLAALAAATINATLETIFHASGPLCWSMLWLGDSTGVIVVTPFLLRLSLAGRVGWRWPPQQRFFEAVLCLGLLFGVEWLVFDTPEGGMGQSSEYFSTTQYLEYLPFPFVVWAAIRFETWGAVGANLSIALLAIAGVVRGDGAFVLQTSAREQALLSLQVFLAIVATTSLCLSAAIAERQQLHNTLEEQVRERTLQLQEQIQETQQLNSMKTVFLQAVAHDLRTSIMGLSMLLKNLQNRDGDEIALSRSNLKRMIQGSDRQIALINALAEDHFAEHHTLTLDRQKVSLAELVDRLIPHWQAILEQNQITLKNKIAPNVPAIEVDARQIQVVFEHLLLNALKHNPPGIQITLEAHLETKMLRCIIRDNGVGMTPKQCQQLFKLYVRNLHNHRLTGVGLGSYQCRQIIEAHGGQIGVESTPNMGSQFWFTLPLLQT